MLDKDGNSATDSATGVTATPTGHLASWIGNSASNYKYDGSIAEILVYNTALNDVNRQAVESYQSNKYLVPEPSTLVLLVTGGLAAILVCWRRRRRLSK